MLSSTQTNAIVWIHSLPEGEMEPTRRILEDLEGLATAGGFPVFENYYLALNTHGAGDQFICDRIMTHWPKNFPDLQAWVSVSAAAP